MNSGERGTGRRVAGRRARFGRTIEAGGGGSPQPHVPRFLFPVPRSQTGFSLIEVIAAILLLAVAFTALMQVVGGAIRLTSQAAQRSEAALWARSLLDSVYTLDPISTGSRDGRFDAHYRWHLEVSQATPSGAAGQVAPIQLYKLDLTVRWGQSPHERSAHFSTLRAASPPLPGLTAQATR